MLQPGVACVQEMSRAARLFLAFRPTANAACRPRSRRASWCISNTGMGVAPLLNGMSDYSLEVKAKNPYRVGREPLDTGSVRKSRRLQALVMLSNLHIRLRPRESRHSSWVGAQCQECMTNWREPPIAWQCTADTRPTPSRNPGTRGTSRNTH